MFKKNLILILALLGAVGGLFLRAQQLASSFEPMSGLLIPNSPQTLALLALCLVFILLLGLLSYGYKQSSAPQALGDERSASAFFALLLSTAAGLMTLLALPSLLRSASIARALPPEQLHASPLLLYLLAALCLLGGCAMIYLGFSQYLRRKLKASRSFLLPGFLCCLWLMVSYQIFAGEPVLARYLPLLLAIASSLLLHYSLASNSFAKPHRARIAFYASMTLLFCLIALPGEPELYHQLLCGAQALYAFAALLRFARGELILEAADLPEAEAEPEAEADPA